MSEPGLIDREESEATAFAMYLLVPTGLLQQDLDALSGIDISDDEALAKLAKKYGVSQAVMAIRIYQVVGNNGAAKRRTKGKKT